MKTKRKIKSFLLGVLMTAVTVCGATSLFGEKTEVSAEVRESQAIMQTYIRNDVFTVPDAKIVHKDKEYDATKSILVYPDGNAYEGGEHILTQEGEYTLKYIAELGGENLIAEKQFTVVASYYSFESTEKNTNSLKSASYEFVDSFEMTPNDENSGLRVSIPVDTKFQVNQAIDLTTLKDQPIITIYPYNDTFLLGRDGKTVEAHDIVVTLTDCNDPNNYIELQYHWTTREQTSYFAPILYYMAGTCGSERTSFDEKSTATEKSFEYNGKFYEKRKTGLGMYSLYDRSDVYGERAEDGTVTVTRPGNKQQLSVNDEYVKSCGFSFYFDNQTNEVYAGEILGGTSVQKPRLVSNTSQAEIYGEKAFKGFSTGKVYLTVHAEQYNSSNSYAGTVFATNLEISNICGMTGTQLNKGENTAKDTTKPYIFIDGVENEEQTLHTQKGSEILFPNAKVYDSNLKGFTTFVYFNYGKDNQVSVAHANGKFTAAKVGTYTIIYKAVDTFGNTQTKLLHVISTQGESNAPLTFSVEKVTEAQAGKELVLPISTLTSKNIGAFTKAYYSYNGEEYIPVEDESFFIEHVGEYSLKYVYGDLVHNYEYEYKFNAAPSDVVTFDEVCLPYYFIKGAKYTLDDLYAYVYTEVNSKATITEMFISEDGQDFVKIDSSVYEVKANENVVVKYVCNGQETVSESIPVVDVGFNGELKKGAYFQGEGFTRESDYEGTLYASERTGNNTLQFINTVSLSNFSFEYIIPEGYTNFKYLEFTLTDYYDRNNFFTVNVRRNASLNNQIAFVIGEEFAFSSTLFENSVALFYYRSNKIFLRDSFIDIGTKFITDKALFEVRLIEATGKNGVKIRQIGNSVLDSMTYDAMPSLMSFADSLAVSVEAGEVITVSAPNIFDTFSPFLKSGLALYATAPDGTNIKTLEGVALERGCDPLGTYSFKVEQSGIYWIYYEYNDQKGNSIIISASMSIKDKEAPLLVLASGYNSETVVEAKLNTVHEIQSYTCTDNKTRAEKLSMSIVILKPTGEIYVEDEKSITLDSKGEWRIIYYCIDGDGNATTEYYTINVQ